MKKITNSIFLTALVLLLFPTGCTEDLLDQNNTNTVSTGIFWQNADDARLAVNGMYHPITNTFFWGRIIHTGAMLRSDAFNVRPFGPNTAMSTFQGEPGAARWATEPFQEPYKCIFRANAILENVNADNIPDEAERNSILGQAHFMRGFSHFYLVNLFGNVPIVTNTAENEADFFPQQSTPAEVWAAVEADFAAAAAELPTTWEGIDKGRPTAGAAQAFLGKSRLYQGNWSGAQQAFDAMPDVYDLLPADQYEDNFTTTNENNVESVFELQFLGIDAFAWGVDVPGVGTMGNYHIDYAPPSKSPDQSHYMNAWVRDLFEANGEEVRRNATLVYDFEGATGYGGVPFAEDMAEDIALADTEDMEAIFSRKYAGMEIGTRDQVDFLGTNVGTNWRIIRYADVLLMRAEALNEQGNSSAAADLVNRVRERAGVDLIDTDMSQDDMRQAIIDERVLELTGEGHRFFDLVRWGLADDYLGTTSLHGDHPKSLSGGTFQSNKHEWIWIPVSELSANSNLMQNPGY